MSKTNRSPEREYTGSIWKHPYLIYVLLTMGLFMVLVFIGWFAWTNGWVPSRGVLQ